LHSSLYPIGKKEPYPFIDNLLNQLPSLLNSTWLADDGELHKVTSLGASAILILCGHLNVLDTRSGLDLLDLSALRSNDLSRSAGENGHWLLSLLSLLLRLDIAAIIVALVILFGDFGLSLSISVIAGVGDSSKGIDEVLE
jgi:hypothetical protein